MSKLDSTFLRKAHCYFGDGTFAALLMDEFRESRDIDFLCSDREGFRLLRETVRSSSLGEIVKEPLQFAREIRSDRDGIRTFIEIDDVRIKFEIIQEARIDLSGKIDALLGIPVLDIDKLCAEKLLANTDRGLDESTRSRDLIDLAFLVVRYGDDVVQPALEIAEHAYGNSIVRYMKLVLEKLAPSSGYYRQCVKDLGITDTKTLRRGLKVLRKIAS